MNNFAQEINYVRLAATWLKQASDQHNLGLKHTQCHELVAAYLGYASKAALDADLNPCAHDLHWVHPERETLASRIQQISGLSSQFLLNNIDALVDCIRIQLSPACVVSGVKHYTNIPVGGTSGLYASEEWISPRMVGHGQNGYGFCRCCGHDTAYSLDDLDNKWLCSDHSGEFDLSPEEIEDYDSYAENIRNNY